MAITAEEARARIAELNPDACHFLGQKDVSPVPASTGDDAGSDEAPKDEPPRPEEQVIALSTGESVTLKALRIAIREGVGDDNAFRLAAAYWAEAEGRAVSAQGNSEQSPVVPPATTTETATKSASGSSEATFELAADRAPAPRGAARTVIYGLSGLLFVQWVLRWALRNILGVSQPGTLRLTPSGVNFAYRVDMLGRTIREQDIFIPRDGLAVAAREVRYGRARLYAGLLGLTAGSFIGCNLFIDGLRAGSPSLIFWGLLFAALGVAIEFFFVTIIPARSGQCRIVFVPARGGPLCLGPLPIADADSILKKLR